MLNIPFRLLGISCCPVHYPMLSLWVSLIGLPLVPVQNCKPRGVAVEERERYLEVAPKWTDERSSFSALPDSISPEKEGTIIEPKTVSIPSLTLFLEVYLVKHPFVFAFQVAVILLLPPVYGSCSRTFLCGGGKERVKKNLKYGSKRHSMQFKVFRCFFYIQCHV